MDRHGWLITCAVLLSFPSPSGAQDGSSGDREPTDRQLRRLEAKYEETGEPKYLFERALTLEQMEEYQFALEIIEQHREAFENDSDVEGVAVVEQRLRRHVDGSAGSGGETARRDGPGPVDWTLLGVGAGSVAGGVTAILVAEHRAKRLRCSPASDGDVASGCGGVRPYTGLTRPEFDAKRRGVRTLRGLGIGFGAVGLGLATWGVVRMVQPADRSRPEDRRAGLRFRPTLAWTSGGAGVGLTFRF